MNDKQSVLHRFWLFGGECYYAVGGFNDFMESFPKLQEAVREAEQQEKGSTFDWWHVFDVEERRVVAQSEWQAYGWAEGKPIIRGG